jgi:hypothetical protein
MIKVLILSMLIASTSVICPAMTINSNTATPIPNTATPIVNTLTLIAATGGPALPSGASVITWSKNTNNEYIFNWTAPAVDFTANKAYFAGLGDVAASISGVNGFLGGFFTGPALNSYFTAT